MNFYDAKNQGDPIEFPAIGILFFDDGFVRGTHAILIDRYDKNGEYFYASDTGKWINSLYFPNCGIHISDLRDSVDVNDKGLLRQEYNFI